MTDAGIKPVDRGLSVLRALRGGEPNLAVRGAISLISGLILLAGALATMWLMSKAFAGRGMRFRISDEQMGLTLAAFGGVWLFLLSRIWVPARAQRFSTALLFKLMGLWAVTAAVGIGIDGLVVSEEEYLIAAVIVLAAAITFFLILSAGLRYRAHKPVITPDDLVDVVCPQCGYSLIGLRELRCPECGLTFAIDELIRAQNYGDASRPNEATGERHFVAK